MLSVPIPQDDDARVADLRRLEMSLTTPEAVLDDLTRELARIFDVPVASISFMDGDTQYYKSEVGLPPPFSVTRMGPRAVSLCSYVVGLNELLVIEDLSADERFRDHPAVVESGMRFYAGAPLRAESGRALGSICIVDMKPRTMTQREAEMLRLLARGVMAQVELQVASRKLLQRSVQIDRDLQQAVHVQEFLLPPARIDGEGWRIDHLYRPVERLGGDFVDVYRRTDGRLAILVADVSGHGTSAALTTTMAKTAFQRAAPDAPSPTELLGAIHRELVGLTPPDQFLSAIAVLFDPTDGGVHLASAGHPEPLLIRDSGVEAIEQETDMLLLVLPETKYERHTRLTLDAGDRLLLYTDGAFEVFDDNGAWLDVDGLCRLASQVAAGNGDAFLPTLFERIKDYSSEPLHDDVAMLSITINGVVGR